MKFFSIGSIYINLNHLAEVRFDSKGAIAFLVTGVQYSLGVEDADRLKLALMPEPVACSKPAPVEAPAPKAEEKRSTRKNV